MQPQPFDFGVGFQRSVLWLCMHDEAFCVSAMQYLKPEHFTTEPLGWVYTTFQRYWERYARPCVPVALFELLKHETADKQGLYGMEASAIVQTTGVAEEFVKQQLQEFVRRQVFAVAHRESAHLFDIGKQVEAYDVMGRAMDQVHQIQFDSTPETDFYATLDQRYKQRIHDATTMHHELFSTGIPDLDKAAGGGLQRGEVWAIMAYAKRGKTTWMINRGFEAAFVHHIKVLHFVLEGRLDQITGKYDALHSQQLYSEIRTGQMGVTTYKYLQDVYGHRHGLLRIVVLNDWDVNVTTLQAHMTRLRAQGFVPDLLIVDYQDLLRSRSRVDSETQHQVNSARDLKRLVNTEGVACWTGWQAQRPPKGKDDRPHILRSGDIADAYAKVRIADAYGSLNATTQEMREGYMRLYMESHRDSDVNQLWRLKNDLARSRMGITYERIKEETAASSAVNGQAATPTTHQQQQLNLQANPPGVACA